MPLLIESFRIRHYTAQLRHFMMSKQSKPIKRTLLLEKSTAISGCPDKNKFAWLFLERCVHYVLEEEKRLQELLDTPAVKFDMDVLTFYMSGQIAMMLQWYLREFDTPVEEMTQKYIRLMHTPLLPPDEIQ